MADLLYSDDDEILEDMARLTDAISHGPPPVIKQEEVSPNVYVSTVVTWDMGPETALVINGQVYVVQRYKTPEEALAGHDAWVKKASEFGDSVCLNVLGYGLTVQPEIVSIAIQR